MRVRSVLTGLTAVLARLGALVDLELTRWIAGRAGPHRPPSSARSHSHYCADCDQEWTHGEPACPSPWPWRCPACTAPPAPARQLVPAAKSAGR